MNRKIKLAYCIENLTQIAGTERMMLSKANYLVGTGRYDVHIIIKNDMTITPSCNENIHFINLTATDKKNYYRKLSEYLCDIRFDFCITFGGINIDFIPKINDRSIKILDSQFSFDIYKKWELAKGNNFYRKFIGNLKTILFIKKARKFDKIIVLTNNDKQLWTRFCENVSYIHNGIKIRNVEQSSLKNKQIISVGRLDYNKGFDMLIDAMKIVCQRHPEWVLNIYGDGGIKHSLENLIVKNELQKNVFLKGHTDNLDNAYMTSSIFALSSRSEGFGLVILEAQTFGLPVVTFATPSGPAEIVNNNKDGFVIDRVGDIKSYANKLIELIENYEMRVKMGSEGRKNIGRFKLEDIMIEWDKLFNKLLIERGLS